MSAEVLAGEVWQESDGVLLLYIEPGVWWRDFNGLNVPWDSPNITHPLTRLLDTRGRIVVNMSSHESNLTLSERQMLLDVCWLPEDHQWTARLSDIEKVVEKILAQRNV